MRRLITMRIKRLGKERIDFLDELDEGSPAGLALPRPFNFRTIVARHNV